MGREMKNWAVLFIFLFVSGMPAFSVQSGGVEYVVPIDYSLLDEKAINDDAEKLFSEFINSPEKINNPEFMENLINDYAVLSKINKDNPLYFVRLGIIYDKTGKDCWAKSNFCRGANLIPDYPYAFFSFGNYFFDRLEYRKALREYLRANDCGYGDNPENLFKIGVIYEKTGDYSNAIKYYRAANAKQNKPEISKKIQILEDKLKINSLYNESCGRK